MESYSRVMESLAFNIMARIDDLLYVDDATKQRATAESVSPCVVDHLNKSRYHPAMFHFNTVPRLQCQLLAPPVK
jgi:hypothetical protein